jgi:Uma2 family endonuclease
MEQMAKTVGDPPRLEYLDGRPYAKVSPKQTHARVQLNLGSILLLRGRSLGQCGTEWRFTVGEADGTYTEFVPDVSFVSNERLASLPRAKREKPPFSPDISIEVRSPSDNLGFLQQKIDRYLRTGSILVLDVDPYTRTIYAHSAAAVRSFTDGERFEDPAFPWFTFEVGDAFDGTPC